MGSTSVSSQLKKGVVELCVLALVSRRDRYGYELIEEISKTIDISEGTVYPILRRLTKEGMFKTYLEESSSGPPRKYYKITKVGEEHLKEMLSAWRSLNKSVESLLKG
jgi:PadR family transcriptional regulator PadR